MYHLDPLISKNISEFLKVSDLQKLINTFGSPLNIVFPEQLDQNAKRFSEIFDKHRMKGEIYYATKSNKSTALMKAALKAGTKIDVASLKELQDAFSVGFTGDQIEATGPKNDDFLILCMLHNVLVNIDDCGELEQLLSLKEKLSSRNNLRILARLNDFSSVQTTFIQKDSRFGINNSELVNFFNILEKNKEKISFEGFAFHLPTTSNTERLIAVENLIDLLIEANKNGFSANTINIGGGYSINYLKSKTQWDNYVHVLKESIIKKSKVMTWNDQGLGFWSDKGTLRGAQTFIDFFQSKDQFGELDELLSSYSSKYKTTIGQLFSENGWEFIIEPGRSLLDQAGITIAEILNTKKSLHNENLIIVDMNRSNLNSQDVEFMSDPLLVKDDREKQPSQDIFEGFIAGNLCLPHDFIMKRKVFFRTKPEKGDLLVFCNTAGYLMDFAESNTLKQKIGNKLSARISDDTFKIYLDENYPHF